MQLTSVNIPAAAKYRWQHGGAKRNPKISLWTEFRQFKNWACNYLNEKNSHVLSIIGSKKMSS